MLVARFSQWRRPAVLAGSASGIVLLLVLSSGGTNGARAQGCNGCSVGGSCPQPCTEGVTCEGGGQARDCCLYTAYGNGCPFPNQTPIAGCCCTPTPIVIDIDGTGIALTNARDGVLFDIGDDGKPDRVAWTRTGSTNAWLALDRNRNGLIDGGVELFGNATPQPMPPTGSKRNGFLALAEFDKPLHGGNGDGVIDEQDLAFQSLLLWQDLDHNGVSSRPELHSLREMRVESIELDYTESRLQDQYGNQFRYRSRVRHRDRRGGRWAWDIILKVDNNLLPTHSLLSPRGAQ